MLKPVQGTPFLREKLTFGLECVAKPSCCPGAGALVVHRS